MGGPAQSRTDWCWGYLCVLGGSGEEYALPDSQDCTTAKLI